MFLLHDESERDHRLLSITNQFESDEYLVANEMKIDEKNITRASISASSSKVECNLQRAK